MKYVSPESLLKVALKGSSPNFEKARGPDKHHKVEPFEISSSLLHFLPNHFYAATVTSMILAKKSINSIEYQEKRFVIKM